MKVQIDKLKKEHLLIALFFISVFMLGIIKIHDTDTWTHLSFGRWIWEHKAIPSGEPFIITGNPFAYNNWLFGFIYYISYLLGGIYGVIFLKALLVTSVFAILLMDAIRPYKQYIVAMAILIVVAVLMRYRFVERPDTFLMIFLAFSIFSLNAFMYDNKKYLYALPLIHVLWANSHTSLSLMFIPFLAFLAGGIIQNYLTTRGLKFQATLTPKQLRTIGMIFLLSFAASLLSPYFIDQYLYGYRVISSDWWRHEIVELQAVTWQRTSIPYFAAAVILISFLLNVRRLPLVHIFLIIPFLYISFTAVRFIFLLGIIGGPIVCRNIMMFLETRDWKDLQSRITLVGATMIWIILWLVLSLTKTINPFHDKTEFGLGVNYVNYPELALQYMDRNHIKGLIFNTFHFGGYITWRDFPRRIPFIDGRGFTSNELLEMTKTSLERSSELDYLEKKYGFQTILLEYPRNLSQEEIMPSGIDLAVSHFNWALVYWDDLSAVYLKRNGPYADIITRDEYNFVKPANGIAGIGAKLYNESYRDQIIAELQRNIKETGSATAHMFLGFVYNETGNYRGALDIFSKALDHPRMDRIAAYNGMAFAYLHLRDLGHSTEYYKKSLSLKKDASTLYAIGMNYLSIDERETAVEYLEKALKLNPNLVSAYPMLISLYKELGMSDKAQQILNKYQKANSFNEGEENFKKGLQAYMGGNFNVAIEYFQKSITVNSSNPVPYSNLAYVYYDIGYLEKAFEYHQKALTIDQNFANSHYGLAIIYKRWGNPDKEKKHLETYLKMEPRGYFSRRAKEEIEFIEKQKNR